MDFNSCAHDPNFLTPACMVRNIMNIYLQLNTILSSVDRPSTSCKIAHDDGSKLTFYVGIGAGATTTCIILVIIIVVIICILRSVQIHVKIA